MELLQKLKRTSLPFFFRGFNFNFEFNLLYNLFTIVRFLKCHFSVNIIFLVVQTRKKNYSLYKVRDDASFLFKVFMEGSHFSRSLIHTGFSVLCCSPKISDVKLVVFIVGLSSIPVSILVTLGHLAGIMRQWSG